MEIYRVYAENMDGERRLLDTARADNGGRGLFDLYADDCGDKEEVVIVEVINTAATLGRKGGKTKSEAKSAAARENGKKGGRPRKEEVKK